MLNKYFLPLTAAGVLALATSPAQAFNLTTDPTTVGGTCQNTLLPVPGTGQISCTTGDGFTISTTDGYLATKTLNRVTGVGISGGSHDVVPAEVNNGELLKLALLSPGVLGSLDFSFLYHGTTSDPGAFSDRVFEVLAATPDGGMQGTLRVTGDNTAVWSFPGAIGSTVVTKSDSTITGGGWYSVLNPFGNNPISYLTMTAVPQPGVPANSPANSDFALVGAEKTPEPTTFAGLALVGAVLIASRRRRFHQAG